MINVVTEHGSSFKGLMAYLLHDVGSRDSSERVAFTHTHNLATDDAEQAWKVMVATAKSQADLKASAGIKNTGRRSHKTVTHYVLSWHPSEYETLTREEMINAATQSLRYLGVDEGERIGKKVTAKRTQRGDEHQAIFVAHDEGPGKPKHIHVALNRVHPEHGVMLPDTKDYEKLSAWSLDFRRAQGKEHLCPERVKNAAKRAQGVLTSHVRKPRNVYEQEQAIEAAQDPKHKTELEMLAKKTKEIRAKEAMIRTRNAEGLRTLEMKHIAAMTSERDRAARVIRAKRSEIRAAYATKIDALTEKQRGERDAFFEGYRTAAGHARNAWQAFQTKEWMRDIRTKPLHSIKHAFTLAYDAGLQLNDIEHFHRREIAVLRGQRRAEEREAGREVRQSQKARMATLRQDYTRDRLGFLLERQMDRAKLRAEWRQLEKDRQRTVSRGGRTWAASPQGSKEGVSDEVLEKARLMREAREQRRRDRGRGLER
ncbi:MAG: relaxase/mobilization nuclease domain-containing protein [Phycisphaera sp.]|nr:MAG: relaxase/mobilization nuclease domain-containing protein [Phycisphaera sp.]